MAGSSAYALLRCYPSGEFTIWRIAKEELGSASQNFTQLQRQIGEKIINILECALVLGMSFFTFMLGHMFDPYLQPLITCMVGGFVIANFTSRRRALKGVQDRMAKVVMVSFFTLAGAALDLTALLQTIYISVIIFAGRMMCILIGAYVGGIIAGDPPKHNRVSWMAYVTQAGVTLGLAKKFTSKIVFGGVPLQR